jgi:phenylpropionate dioxygenase-like ring-hydroxylating dioxygenase large terminal subunit
MSVSTAHELLSGEGQTTRIMCLDQVQVEEFCGFIYVNLDAGAPPLADLSGDLATEIRHWAPDVDKLTFAHRLTYQIKSNWKNVVDNFLECYHCPTAHKDFCTLVDMDTYKVTTHGIYSSHMAEVGKTANAAYSVDNVSVTDHAVWWLWPNTCIMRYPGRGNMIIMHVLPNGPDSTYETYDFFFETSAVTEGEVEAIKYIDKVLQVEDIGLIESVQRGMNTPAFQQGRIVYDPSGSGKSEHAVHHFHGLVLDAYEKAV